MDNRPNVTALLASLVALGGLVTVIVYVLLMGLERMFK
jgi:hypothetical protein